MSKRKKNPPSPPFPDLIEVLTRKVGATGRVQEYYGGVCIEVMDPTAFPWGDVVQELLSMEEEVWLRKSDDRIEIMSKSEMP